MKDMGNVLAWACVTAALIYAPVGGAAEGAFNGSPTAQSGEPAERTYSFFYDQGSHLKDLVKAEQYEEASLLYREHQVDFFDKKREKFAAALDELAVKLSARYQPRFEAAVAALPVEASLEPAAWSAARVAFHKAKEELLAFAPHETLISGNRRSASRDTLAETVESAERSWRATAAEAFSQYSLQQDFFSAYPIAFDDQAAFLIENYSSLEKRLRSAGPDGVVGFYRAYQAALTSTSTASADTTQATPSPLISKLSNLYVELILLAQRGKDQLKVALHAVAEAQKHGLNPTEVPGLSIAFVEATSKTLLKERQIDFPVAIDIDLPFKTAKSTLDEALRASTPYDYILALDVSMAKSQQRAQRRDQIQSQFLSGHREVPNPDYEPARMAVYRAQNAVSSNNAQYCQGYGCLGKGLAGIALAAKLNEVQKVFNATPMTLTEPVYQEYQFSGSDLVARKAVTANYYVIDTRNSKYFKSVFDMGEEKHFRLAYNLHEKDKNFETHIKEFEREDAVKSFDEAPVTVRLSDVLAQFAAKGSDSKPFESLGALRDEMLVDKNTALAEHRRRERDQTATAEEDPRFDSVVVILNPKGALGTGFFVEPDLVLTNYHVVEGAQFVEMKLRNGLETFGKVVKSDVRLDLALVRVQARGTPVQFHSGSIPLGATVEAIGHPKGLEFSITRGIVSALRKKPSPFGVGGKEVLFVQTDTPVNPGNSGGPLFLNKEVVAVNDNKFTAAGIEGIAFSVHYTEIQDFLREGF